MSSEEYEKGYVAGANDICKIINWLRNKPHHYIQLAFDGEWREKEIFDSYSSAEILRRVNDLDDAFNNNAVRALEYMGLDELDKVTYIHAQPDTMYYIRYAYSTSNMVDLYVASPNSKRLHVMPVSVIDIYTNKKS